MSNDKIFKKRRVEREERKINVRKQKSNYWLIACEGEKTEVNYFKKAIHFVNSNIDPKYELKVKIIGFGMNTISLVEKTEDLLNKLDSYLNGVIPYGKVFVVFDKDSFEDKKFDEAVNLCYQRGYVPLWSNEAIEYWFLLHFYYIDSVIDRKEYILKLNDYFKKNGIMEHYKKNDENIFEKLYKTGSLENAIKFAKRRHSECKNLPPSLSKSCTMVYQLFEEIKLRVEELK